MPFETPSTRRRTELGLVRRPIVLLAVLVLTSMVGSIGRAQPGSATWQAEDPSSLVTAARRDGDPARGALIFHRSALACLQCHPLPGAGPAVGPRLTELEDVEDVDLVEAILDPSRRIATGYQSSMIATLDGQVLNGRILERGEGMIRLLDADANVVEVREDDVDALADSPTSTMPEGLVNTLSRSEFLDLVGYLIALNEGGVEAETALKPDPERLVVRIPEYESRVDHAGLIRSWDEESYLRGEAIYQRVCMNCHGTVDQPGSLPTAPRFASGEFGNGSDPFTMYQTVTYGYQRMVAQDWMVPQQKYDVIHYIQERFLQRHNQTRYVEPDTSYLAGLPTGDTFGPEPSTLEPWVIMDYGPSLMASIEVGRDGSNLAAKGVAVRLDSGPGGVSRGRQWILYDHDTMRMAAAWSGEGFVDWGGILFDGRHGVHPHIQGALTAANPDGPGWADPRDGRFDDERIVGRDGRRYGPLPRDWIRYRGHYQSARGTILHYDVGTTEVHESPARLDLDAPGPEFDAPDGFVRHIWIGPRDTELTIRVAHLPGADARQLVDEPTSRAVLFARPDVEEGSPSSSTPLNRFDGTNALAVDQGGLIDFREHDLTILARIRTTEGGTILSHAVEGDWSPDDVAWFVSDGRLMLDIGWVGAVVSRSEVDDGEWHDVALTYAQGSGTVRLFVDGRLDARGVLKPRGDDEHRSRQVRIGFAAPDFPEPQSAFNGQITRVAVLDGIHDPRRIDLDSRSIPGARADWIAEAGWSDRTDSGFDARPIRVGSPAPEARSIVAGLRADAPDVLDRLSWTTEESGDLRLRIDEGAEPLQFAVWFTNADIDDASTIVNDPAVSTLTTPHLEELTRGGAPLWPEIVTTTIVPGSEDDPFAVDVLTRPASNPWSARMRPSGIDFLDDGRAAVISTWDGDVWRVDGIDQPIGELRWQRIASGLFQPLGIKVIDGQITVGCRDQIVVLRDLDGDHETNYYDCFNTDHQVTDHFHEFAMGLETDASGNLYYTKGGRHALEAVVPHHGTLLKVSPDGSRTEILATGFRAPNGVWIEPDGSFILSDQEGHWTPKNRINRVRPGGFYGYMWGYHDVEDPSDAAMAPPICWITNRFDRSPSQAIRVSSPAWSDLENALLMHSYGYGIIYRVLEQQVGSRSQGAVARLPIPSMPTGVMRGRFHNRDGHLYACGLFGWAGDRQQPGGFYRIRRTDAELVMPASFEATPGQLRIGWTSPLDPDAIDKDRFALRVWQLHRRSNYGSDHIDEHAIPITDARLSPDRSTLILEVPDLTPTMGLALRYRVRSASGFDVEDQIHGTIHTLQTDRLQD